MVAAQLIFLLKALVGVNIFIGVSYINYQPLLSHTFIHSSSYFLLRAKRDGFVRWITSLDWPRVCLSYLLSFPPVHSALCYCKTTNILRITTTKIKKNMYISNFLDVNCSYVAFCCLLLTHAKIHTNIFKDNVWRLI